MHQIAALGLQINPRQMLANNIDSQSNLQSAKFAKCKAPLIRFYRFLHLEYYVARLENMCTTTTLQVEGNRKRIGRRAMHLKSR